MVTASVIIPTYNYGQFINEAINSVLCQDYPQDEIEIIVVDDGSNDNTEHTLKPFIESKQIQYFYQNNSGKASATSFAIDKCIGKYIFNLDADDLFLESKISESVRIFNSDEDIVHVSSPANCVDDKYQSTEIERIPQDIVMCATNGPDLLKMFYRNNILFGGGSTFAARASVMKAVAIPAECDMYIDEFLILAVLPHGKSYFFERPLSIWRIHQLNYSGNNSDWSKQFKKAKRLLDSSSAILAYLKVNSLDPEITNIYKLQHATRAVVFEGFYQHGGLKTILRYAKTVFFEIKPNWLLMQRYYVFNRFIPVPLYKALKKIQLIFS
jgi:glycosyltransferase involved in cell wall biosynthesis